MNSELTYLNYYFLPENPQKYLVFLSQKTVTTGKYSHKRWWYQRISGIFNTTQTLNHLIDRLIDHFRSRVLASHRENNETDVYCGVQLSESSCNLPEVYSKGSFYTANNPKPPKYSVYSHICQRQTLNLRHFCLKND